MAKRAEEEGGKCARAVEEGALSLRALLSAGSTPLSSSFLSTEFSLSTSRSSPPPFLTTVLRIRPYIHAREHLSYIQPRRFFASSFFAGSTGSTLLSLSLSLSLFASLLSSFRLRPSRVDSVRSTLVDEEEEEEKVGKEEEGEQWD